MIVHLIKLEASRQENAKAYWRAEIVAFRQGWRRKMTPSIRAIIADELEALHRDAFELAEARSAADEPAALPLDRSRRWSLEEIADQAL